MGAYVIIGILGSFLNSMAALIASRIAIGACVAVTMCASAAFSGHFFHGHERQRYFSYQTSFVGGCGLGLLAASGFLSNISWRLVFALHLLVLPLVVMAARYLNDESSRRLNMKPKVSSVEGVILKLMPAYLLAFAFSTIFFVMPTQFPFLMEQFGIQDMARIGITMGIANLSCAITSLAYSRLIQLMPAALIFCLGFSAMALGFLSIGMLPLSVGPIFCVLLIGLGWGLNLPNFFSIVIFRSPEHARGRALAGLTMSIFLGQFVSPLWSQSLVTTRGLSACFDTAGLMLATLAVGLAIVAISAKARANATGEQ
jgi:MFS family permease